MPMVRVSNGGTAQSIEFTPYPRSASYTINVNNGDLIIVSTYGGSPSVYGVQISGATHTEISSGNIYMWLCTPTQNTVTITASDANIGVFKLE